MITSSDSLNTLEFKDYYVILPSTREFLSWKLKDFIKKNSPCRPCKENFTYNSLENSIFLTVKNLKKFYQKN